MAPVINTNSLNAFTNFMNNLKIPFQYDYAVAIMKFLFNFLVYYSSCINCIFLSLDIWSSLTNLRYNERAGVIGFSSSNAICGVNRYSISEEKGFVSIPNLAHLLGIK